MRGILITPHGEIGTEGAAIFIPRLSIPGLLWWGAALMWHFYDFYDILRQMWPGTTPGLVTGLGWCNGLSCLFGQSEAGFCHHWPMRSSHSNSPQLTVWCPSILSDSDGRDRGRLQPGQNTINVTNKAAQTANKWQSISFYLLNISYNLSHLFDSPCEDPAAGSGWLITADDRVNEAETPGHPDQLSLSPMMISR